MIEVLLVDDEALTLELHRTYVERLEGFRVVGECSGARAAVRAIVEQPDQHIDLVLLDMTMADGTGLDVLRYLRARSADVDVIAITAVRDADVVRQVVALGAIQYLVKPFAFSVFAERLEQYRSYREQSRGTAGEATQAEIDALLGALRPTGSIRLPKGLSADTLALVTTTVRDHGPLSASEAAEAAGISRVAARRYLEHLAGEGRVTRVPRYGGRGRPETEYRWNRPR